MMGFCWFDWMEFDWIELNPTDWITGVWIVVKIFQFWIYGEMQRNR